MKRPRGAAEMPFLDHLEELRWRLIWSAVAVLVCTIGGFFLITEFDVLGILQAPISPLLPDGKLNYTSPTEPMTITLKLSFVIGLILASPVVVYHVWAFVSPALFEREKKAIVPALAGGLVLFMAGVAMAYFLALPLGLRFLLGFQTEALTPIVTIGEYLRFAVRLILAFGLIFELPLISIVLASLGLITPDTLRKYRRHAVVGVAVVAAVLTPADIGSMTMMMLPMLLLYEVSILLVKIVAREDRRVPEESPQPAAD